MALLTLIVLIVSRTYLAIQLSKNGLFALGKQKGADGNRRLIKFMSPSLVLNITQNFQSPVTCFSQW